MHSVLFAASLAAGALALPRNHIHKRLPQDVVVTATDVVIVTDVAIVTVTGPAPSDPAPVVVLTTTTVGADSTTSSAIGAPTQNYDWHKSHPWWTRTWTWSAPAPTSTEAASPPAPPPSSYETPTSSYIAPPPPSSTYVAPTTSEVPATTWAPPPSSAAPTSTWAPPPSSAPSSAAGPSSLPSGPVPTDYVGVAVWHHNVHRLNHSAPELEWDSGLASTAGKIAATCKYAHSMDVDGGGYGQNIAAGVEPANISAVITDLFYNGEVNYYPFGDAATPDMTNFEKWGHFSQIVWKATTKVGCATQDCNSQGLVDSDGNPMSSLIPKYFTVCNYDSPGNYGGEYGNNVASGSGFANADWNFHGAYVQ